MVQARRQCSSAMNVTYGTRQRNRHVQKLRRVEKRSCASENIGQSTKTKSSEAKQSMTCAENLQWHRASLALPAHTSTSRCSKDNTASSGSCVDRGSLRCEKVVCQGKLSGDPLPIHSAWRGSLRRIAASGKRGNVTGAVKCCQIPLQVRQVPANPPHRHNHMAPRCRCRYSRLASAAVHQPYRKTRFKQRGGNGGESASFVHQPLLCLSNVLGYHTNQGAPELG